MDILKILVGLGLPSAIIAMAAIAFLFKDKYDKVSKASLILSISLAGLLGLYQLIALITGRDISVVVQPNNFSAITADGRIHPVDVMVHKGDKVVKKVTYSAFDSVSFSNRLLTLGFADSNRFKVMNGAFSQGRLNFHVLRDNGWRPGNEVPQEGRTPRYWFTHKVYVDGDDVVLGDTGDSGILSLKFFAIKDNRAQVRLILKGRDKPRPRSVGILNKGLGAQDFEGLPSFYIAVREANFSENWAAFSVFQYRGY
jgi:hypothetical protein